MLTRKQALLETAELWSDLSMNPNLEKSQATSMKGKGGKFMHDCPCCQFVHEQTGLKMMVCANGYVNELEKCPLVKLWPGGCQKDDSPYAKWQMSSRMKLPRERMKNARDIRDAALKEAMAS